MVHLFLVVEFIGFWWLLPFDLTLGPVSCCSIGRPIRKWLLLVYVIVSSDSLIQEYWVVSLGALKPYDSFLALELAHTLMVILRIVAPFHQLVDLTIVRMDFGGKLLPDSGSQCCATACWNPFKSPMRLAYLWYWYILEFIIPLDNLTQFLTTSHFVYLTNPTI